MFGIGNDQLSGDPFGQGQDMNAGERLVGRILSAEYQIGIQRPTPANQALASQALAQLLGLGLGRIFR